MLRWEIAGIGEMLDYVRSAEDASAWGFFSLDFRP